MVKTRNNKNKQFIKPSEIASSKLSRLINGESEFGSDVIIKGEQDFINQMVNGEEKPDAKKS